MKRQQNINETSASKGKGKGVLKYAGLTNTVDAAALQDHWMRNLGLGAPKQRRSTQTMHQGHAYTNGAQADVASRICTQKSRPNHKKPVDIRQRKPQLSKDIHTQPEYQKWECEECGELNQLASNSCKKCRKRRPPRIVRKPEQKTLAQMRGLVAGPPPKLTDTEWKQVEALSLRRSDPAQGCPICMEHFGLRDTLILSCSHTFHRRCLESFEKFSDSPTDRCPVCRHPHYEKKEFFHGATFYREKKVKLIQSVIRMMIQRKKYHQLRREYYKAGRGDTSMRRRYYAQSLEKVQKKWNHSLHQRASEIDKLINDSDSNMEAVRLSIHESLNNLMERRGQARPVETASSQSAATGDQSHTQTEIDLSAFPSEVQNYMVAPNRITHNQDNLPQDGDSKLDPSWREILKQTLRRLRNESKCGDENCCPICICDLEFHQPIQGQAKNFKSLSLLSCSHIFHESCLTSFEAFSRDGGKHPKCPICRRQYQSVKFEHVCETFSDSLNEH